jgi:hypothetical protein
MSAPQTQRVASGDLCSVRDHGHRRLQCGGLQVGVADVPMERHGVPFTIELALCELHWAEMHASADPIELARTWVA